MSSIIRGNDNIDSANIATDTDLKEIGVNQTWQDMTSSRSSGVTYTNNTGKPIQVIVRSSTNATGFTGLNLSINAEVISSVRIGGTDTNAERLEVNAIIPNGSLYLVDNIFGTLSRYELR